MRQIATINKSIANARAIVYFNSDYDEYVVKFRQNGIRLQDADYFTNDREDAINTAHAELNRMAENKND